MECALIVFHHTLVPPIQPIFHCPNLSPPYINNHRHSTSKIFAPCTLGCVHPTVWPALVITSRLGLYLSDCFSSLLGLRRNETKQLMCYMKKLPRLRIQFDKRFLSSLSSVPFRLLFLDKCWCSCLFIQTNTVSKSW